MKQIVQNFRNFLIIKFLLNFFLYVPRYILFRKFFSIKFLGRLLSSFPSRTLSHLTEFRGTFRIPWNLLRRRRFQAFHDVRARNSSYKVLGTFSSSWSDSVSSGVPQYFLNSSELSLKRSWILSIVPGRNLQFQEYRGILLGSKLSKRSHNKSSYWIWSILDRVCWYFL